ncbi:MAG: AI-2E family transporter [Opitutae bacterium]|nr:AI-2E family transporter [Opitutae bacterium]
MRMASEHSPLLTPEQRQLVGSAVAGLALATIVALAFVAFVYGAQFVSAFSRVIWPLAVAGILSLILRPVVAFFETRLKIRRPVAVILLYGLFLLVVAALVFAFAPAIVAQLLDFAAYLPTLWQNSQTWGEQHFPEWLAMSRRYLDIPAVKHAVNGLTAQAQNFLGHLVPTFQQAGAGIFGFFGFFASVAVVPVYLFFFLLTDADPTRELPAHLPFLKPAQRADAVFLVREFLGILVAFFRGQMLIGLITGVLLATGFSVAGLRFGLVIGLVMGLLNIVPYLGSILGLSVVIPLALFQPGGGFGLVGGCLAVFAVMQAVEGWFLTPRIIGHQTGLHPVAIIVAIFFWGQALGGVLGMMLAVPLTAFVVTAWRLVRRKYFHSPDKAV